MIDFRCTSCATPFAVPDAAAGKKSYCPKCGLGLQVPTPKAAIDTLHTPILLKPVAPVQPQIVYLPAPKQSHDEDAPPPQRRQRRERRDAPAAVTNVYVEGAPAKKPSGCLILVCAPFVIVFALMLLGVIVGKSDRPIPVRPDAGFRESQEDEVKERLQLKRERQDLIDQQKKLADLRELQREAARLRAAIGNPVPKTATILSPEERKRIDDKAEADQQQREASEKEEFARVAKAEEDKAKRIADGKAMKEIQSKEKKTAEDDHASSVLLGFAKSLKAQGKTAVAIDRLQVILDKYPGTEAAAEAAKLIEKWKE